jgi:TonB family protein
VRALAGNTEALAASRDFRRLLAASAAAHALLALALGVRLHPQLDLAPTPVMVDLIAPSQAPAAAPAAAAAAAAAKPKPVLEKVVVIPKERRVPPKPPAKPKPEAKPAPEAKPVPKPPAPAAPTKSAEEILADLRSRVDARGEAAAAVPAAAGRTGGRFDPEMSAYERRVLALLQSNWVGLRAFGSDPSLLARYAVRVDGSGRIVSLDLLRSSGNSYFDDAAERAIRKSAPLPPPPRPVILDVNFNPGGVA